MKKKLIAGILSVTLIAALVAGCGGSSSGSSTSATNEPAAEEPAAEGSAEVVDEGGEETVASGDVITLTGAIFLESIESSSIKTDPVSNYIRDRFGIQFDVISDCSGDTWNEKFPVMLAADELPDVFLVPQDPATGYAGSVKKLVDAGAVVCLDDYPELFEEYNSDPILEASMEYSRQFYCPDGKAYCFPMYFGESNYAKGLLNAIALRWDAYEAAGCPEFKNYDELADVLKMMQDVAPPDVNGKQAYAVGGWFADGQGWGDWPMLFAYGQCASCQGSAVQWHSEDDISDINFYADKESPYWEYLKFMNKCYRLGILDPDAFTMTWDEYNATIENGSLLYIAAGWLTDQKNDICAANVGDEMAGFVHFPAPADYKENFSGGSWDYGTTMYCISSKCENIEAAIELLSWISSQEGSLIMENGPEGLAWNFDENGVPVGNDDYLQMGQFDSTSYELYGSNLYHHLKGYSDATPLSQYGNVTANLRLSDQASTLSMKPYEAAAMEHFGASSFTDENWLNRANTTYTLNLPVAVGSLPEEFNMNLANITNEFFNQQYQAIQAATEEEFEAIQDQMIKYAEDNRVREMQQYYIDSAAAAKEKLLPIANQISNALK